VLCDSKSRADVVVRIPEDATKDRETIIIWSPWQQ
jgi:hypothetical protein